MIADDQARDKQPTARQRWLCSHFLRATAEMIAREPESKPALGSMTRPILVTIVLLFATALSAQAPRTSGKAAGGARTAVVRLHGGRNAVDLLGNGAAAFIDVAYRENFNAHGFHVAIFQVRERANPTEADSPLEWQIVPFFGGVADSVIGTEIFRTGEGADCILRDLRVVRHAAGRPVEVVIADREFGNSFADSAAVLFYHYELRTNADGDVGWPAYYLYHTRTVRAKHRYCDVDDAFDRELGFGRAGLVVWDGPR